MVDYADTSMALHGTTAVDFKFTSANEIVDGSNLTATTTGTADAVTLIDGNTNDNDVLNLTLTTNITPGANFTMQNIETLNIAAQNTAAMTVNLTGAKISGLKTIIVSGSPTADVKVSNFENTGVSTIDASGLTNSDAKFTVDANAVTKGLTIIGGAAADKITGGSGADVLTGNGASDTFVVTNVTAGKIDKITDFEAGSDKIATGTNKTKAAVNYTDKGEFSVSAYATLDDILATFATGKANATVEKEAYSFVYDNKTYVLIDNGTTGYDKATDSVVEITGYTGTSTAADFLNA